jgi:hypothetical protein
LMVQDRRRRQGGVTATLARISSQNPPPCQRAEIQNSFIKPGTIRRFH